MTAMRGLAEGLAPGDLDSTLQQIAKVAVDLVPEAAYSSVTVLFSDGRLQTTAETDPLVLPLDEAQYQLQEGPCYEAATEAAHVIAPDLENDDRFTKYGPIAVAAGVRAQAGIRLFDTNRSQGALNLYSHHTGAFADFETIAPLFRHQVGMVIGYAQEISDLKEALATRKMIGQAIGIIMERYQLTDDRAFAFLTRLSQQRNVKLRLIAQELIAASEDRSEKS